MYANVVGWKIRIITDKSKKEINCILKISIKNYKPFISTSGCNIAAVFVVVVIYDANKFLVSMSN